MPPQFLVVGHVVQDLAPDESADRPAWRLGGTASYAAVLATRLGLDTAVLTATGPDLTLKDTLPGAKIARVPSPQSSHFRNLYTPEGRVQEIPQRASAIKPDALPDDWRGAEIVLLGPVAGEVDDALADCFPEALVGVCVQGWLREIGGDGRVRPLPPQRFGAETLFPPAQVLFVSDEDVHPSAIEAALTSWSRQVEVLAYTRGEHGAEICERGTWRHIDAFPAETVDPTGAGDVFAAAFLVRYRERGDVWEASRFASAAASLIVEGEGLTNTPDRTMIDKRLRAHPDIIAK